MVKKKIQRPKAVQLLQRPAGNSNCNCNCKCTNSNSNNNNKLNCPDKDSEDLEGMDHSIIREPINLGQKNVRQILTCISKGTPEAKDLILNECNIIYECRVCQNLFRSLANFVAHKRVYCKEHKCEEMVLCDPEKFMKDLTKQRDEDVSSCTASAEQPEIAAQSNESNSSEEIKLESENHDNSMDTNLTDSKAHSLETDLETELTHNVSPKRVFQEVSIEKDCKRQRLENIVSCLKSQPEENVDNSLNEEQKDVSCNDEPPVLDSKIELFTENIAELEAHFQLDAWKALRKNSQKQHFLYKCPCGMNIASLSNAVRHLTNEHQFSKKKAKILLFWYHLQTKNDSIGNIEENLQQNSDSNSTDESKVESSFAILAGEQPNSENESDKPHNVEDNLHDPQGNLLNCDSNPPQPVTEPSSSQEFPQKRYSTRHRRKKCFFDCELGKDNSCYYHSKLYKHSIEHEQKKESNNKNCPDNSQDSKAKSQNLDIKTDASTEMKTKKNVSIRILKNPHYSVDHEEKLHSESSNQSKASTYTNDTENLSTDDLPRLEISPQMEEKMTEIANFSTLSCSMCPQESFATAALLQHHVASNHLNYPCASPQHSPMGHFPTISSSDQSECSESSSPKLITKLSIKNIKQQVSSTMPSATAPESDTYKNKSDNKLKLHLRTIGSKKYQIVNL